MLDNPQRYLSLADAHYVDEHYHLAVDAYTAGLVLISIEDQHKLVRYRLLSHRAATLLKLNRSAEALQDSEIAVTLLPLADLRPGESEATYRWLAEASYREHQYNTSLTAWEQAQQLTLLNTKKRKELYDDWIEKCRLQLGVVETKSPAKPNTALLPKTTPVPTAKITPGTVPKYQYYQSDQFVTVSIVQPGLSPDNLLVTFTPTELTAILRYDTASQATLVMGQLYETIIPGESKVKYMAEKTLIKLRKKEKGFEWPELMSKKSATANKKPAPKPVAATSTTAPSSASTAPQSIATSNPPHLLTTRPYASTKDWNALEQQLAADEEKEKPEGDEALQKLFSSIYANADENTKRAMIKSYQTSGGTCLSTNWEEVAAKDYEAERTAPSGMEWKTWEGNKVKMVEEK